MSKVINLVMAFALILGVISSPVIVIASCAIEPVIAKEIETSEAIFVGKVIEIKNEREFKIQFSPMSIFPQKKSILFEVKNTWKGVSQSQIIIDTYNAATIAYDFKVGNEYLVYAKQSEFKRLATNICDATKELSLAEQDLTVLGAGKSPTEDVNLQDTFNNNPLYSWISLIGMILIVLFFFWRRTKR